MRNLKKVMALALATVMLFGMMVMGAGAADYKDADQIDAKYATATDLLYAIGAFQGTPEGNLNPQSTLTRAEAAVSIAKLALTKDVAANLAAVDTGFADVDASYAWAAGSIAYAKKLGIISGVGDNKFDPAGTLTGLQYAKMLLVVLGYDPVAEGYTNNANWAANIDFDALQAGLKKGLTIDLAEVITREQAIQMAANALVADCVWYKTAGSSIVLPDGTTINNGGSAAEKVAAEKADDYRDADQDEKLQLIEKLYPTFELVVDDVDALGYAQKTWKNGTTEVAHAANNTVLKTYTGKLSDVKYGTIYADTGVKGDAIKVYENYIGGTLLGTAKIEKDSTDALSADFNGLTMKVVKNGTENVIVIEKATLAKVEKIEETKTEGKKAVLDIKNAKEEVYKIAAGDYAAGDYVVVTLNKANTKILSVKAATILAGLVTETNKDKTTVYVDGVAYPVAGADAQLKALPAEYTIDGSTKYTFVVEGGYIVAQVSAKAAAATKPELAKVYYLADYVVNKDAWNTDVYYAQLVALVDGTVQLIKVDQTIAAGDKGALYTLKTKDGKTTLEAFTGKDSKGADVFYQTTLNETTIATTDKSVTLGAGKAYLTANTVVYSVYGAQSTLATKAFAGPVFDLDLAAATKTLAVYSKDTAGNFEAEVVLVISEKVLKANKVDPSKSYYYVLSGDLGQVYNAGAKDTFYKVEVVDLKTFEKLTVQTKYTGAGFAEGSVGDYSVYTFAAADVAKTVEVKKEDAVELYNGMLSVDEIVDASIADAKFYNAAGAKDADGKTIAAISGLVKGGKAVADFVVKFSKNATTGVYTIDYVVVTK